MAATGAGADGPETTGEQQVILAWRNSVLVVMKVSSGGQIPRTAGWIEQHIPAPFEPVNPRQMIQCLRDDTSQRFIIHPNETVTIRPEHQLTTRPSASRKDRMFQTAVKFKDFLQEHANVRFRCESREQFATELNAWKVQAHQNCPGNPCSILWIFQVIGWVVVRAQDLAFSKIFPTDGNAFPTRSLADIKAVWEERERNKCGITVDNISWESDRDNSERIVRQGQEVSQIVHIRNTHIDSRTLVGTDLSQNPQDAFKVEPDRQLPFELSPDSTFLVKVQCNIRDVGVLRTALTFSFRASGGGESFDIVRRIRVRCGDSDLADILKPSAPFKKVKRKLRRYGKEVVDGQALVSSQPTFKNKLHAHEVPERTRWAVKQGAATRILRDAQQTLAPSSYPNYFQELLWLEEIAMEYDITTFDLDGALLVREGPFLVLTVPGLAENRPSVLRGDAILANPSGNQARRYRGYAHRVERDRVLLKFHRDFHAGFVQGQRFDISFSFRRTPLRLMHHGLTLAGSITRTIFPESEDSTFGQHGLGAFPGELALGGINCFNRQLNEEQRQAAFNIVNRSSSPLPYLVFGPPGTGKTVTLVEAVLQEWRWRPHNILVTAPSNTAADVLLSRLMASIPPSEMLRFMAFNRHPDQVHPDVQRFCKMDDGHFLVPDLDQLVQYRVIVATCTMAAKLHHLGVPRGHFKTLFIDEAGHAWEPECVAGIAGLAPDSNDRLVVLAGDPKQLGPVVRSSIAKEFGLAQSLLERLMRHPVFSRGESGRFDDRVLTKLLKNYRSHPEILALPNQLFYDGELQAEADADLVSNMLRWEHLPEAARAQCFPLMLHGVHGEEEREGNSPSWFNRDEVTVVSRYVKHLLHDSRGLGIQPKDIGVITPYAKQAEKIRLAFRAEQLSAIMVGSTEQFQGQEKHVIIISTVRSSDEYIPFDLAHNIGFLNNPKRFNVAVTRAKALLLVVANPAVLARDEHWGRLLWRIVDGGGYVGPELPPRDMLAGHWTAAAPEGQRGEGNGGLAAQEEDEVVLERDCIEGHAWRAAD